MKNWPKSRWVQGGIAFVGAIPLAVLFAWLAAELSFAVFARAYPKDGQDGLGSLFVGLLGAFVGEIFGFTFLIELQKRWVRRNTSR